MYRNNTRGNTRDRNEEARGSHHAISIGGREADARYYEQKAKDLLKMSPEKTSEKFWKIMQKMKEVEGEISIGCNPVRREQLTSDFTTYQMMVVGYGSLAGLLSKNPQAEMLLKSYYQGRSEGHIPGKQSRDRKNIFEPLANTQLPFQKYSEGWFKAAHDLWNGQPVNPALITYDFIWCSLGLGFISLMVRKAAGQVHNPTWDKIWPLMNGSGGFPRILDSLGTAISKATQLPMLNKYLKDIYSGLTDRHKEYVNISAYSDGEKYVDEQGLNYQKLLNKYDRLQNCPHRTKQMADELKLIQDIIEAKTLSDCVRYTSLKNALDAACDASASGGFFLAGLKGGSFVNSGELIFAGFGGISLFSLYQRYAKHYTEKAASADSKAACLYATDLLRRTVSAALQQALSSIATDENDGISNLIFSSEREVQDQLSSLVEKTHADYKSAKYTILPGGEAELVSKLFSGNLDEHSMNSIKTTSFTSRIFDVEGRRLYSRMAEASAGIMAENIKTFFESNNLEGIIFLLKGENVGLSGYTDSQGQNVTQLEMARVAQELLTVTSPIVMSGLPNVSKQIKALAESYLEERRKYEVSSSNGLNTEDNRDELIEGLKNKIVVSLEATKSTFH